MSRIAVAISEQSWKRGLATSILRETVSSSRKSPWVQLTTRRFSATTATPSGLQCSLSRSLLDLITAITLKPRILCHQFLRSQAAGGLYFARCLPDDTSVPAAGLSYHTSTQRLALKTVPRPAEHCYFGQWPRYKKGINRTGLTASTSHRHEDCNFLRRCLCARALSTRGSRCARWCPFLRHRRDKLPRVRGVEGSVAGLIAVHRFAAYNTPVGQSSIQRQWNTYNPIQDVTSSILACNDGAHLS